VQQHSDRSEWCGDRSECIAIAVSSAMVTVSSIAITVRCTDCSGVVQGSQYSECSAVCATMTSKADGWWTQRRCSAVMPEHISVRLCSCAGDDECVSSEECASTGVRCVRALALQGLDGVA